MSADCKIQINFKNGQPDLINVYAEDGLELVKLLGQLSESVSDITAASNFLKGASAVAPIAQQPATPAPAPQVPAAPTLPSAEHVCAHGARVYREGVNKAGKAWKGWFCSMPKGQDCPAEWLR